MFYIITGSDREFVKKKKMSFKNSRLYINKGN
jgi:hypothetical protein